MPEKIVLAYSGGLDTSVAIRWLKEERGYEVVALTVDVEMDRESEIAYAQEHSIPINVTKASPYSIDENLWGRSIETGVLEDPWVEPPADVYAWTKSPAEAPDEPAYVEIGFERGGPVSLDGKEIEAVALVKQLNELAGEQGIGRIDSGEDRLAGSRPREIYEAPAGITLLIAHEALKSLTLSKEHPQLKARLAEEHA